MIHYIVLMQDRKFSPGNYFTSHFYKKGEGNETPDFKFSTETMSEIFNALLMANFNKTAELSIEEIILQDVLEITVFFFKEDGNFERSGIYRRMV